MGTTWLPRFGPSCRRPINLELNLPTLGCPWEGGGDLKGRRKTLTWETLERFGIVATLPLFRSFHCQQTNFSLLVLFQG